jgi:hypothetical protein
VEVSIRIWICFGHGQGPHYNFPFMRHTYGKKGLRMCDTSETLNRSGALHVTSARTCIGREISQAQNHCAWQLLTHVGAKAAHCFVQWWLTCEVAVFFFRFRRCSLQCQASLRANVLLLPQRSYTVSAILG